MLKAGGRSADDGAAADGAAAVEFALVFLFLLLPILGGVIDFGFAFNAQIGLSQAAREGVRLEALGTGDPVAAAEGAFVRIGTEPAHASLDTPCPASPDATDRAELSITADYDYFFISMIPGIGENITLRGEAVMRCGG